MALVTLAIVGDWQQLMIELPSDTESEDFTNSSALRVFNSTTLA